MYDTKCIATIKTKRKQVHNHDLGCHSVNFSKHKALQHWNDLDGDYRDLFQKAKLVIKKFWKNL